MLNGVCSHPELDELLCQTAPGPGQYMCFWSLHWARATACIKLLGCTRGCHSPELGIWQEKLFGESCSWYLIPHLESTDRFWPKEVFSSKNIKNNNPESVQSCLHEIRRKRNALKHLPECSACYLWLSGKVTDQILWNWSFVSQLVGWLMAWTSAELH